MNEEDYGSLAEWGKQPARYRDVAKGWSRELSQVGVREKTYQHHWCSAWKQRDGNFLKQALTSLEFISPRPISCPGFPVEGRVLWPGPLSRKVVSEEQCRDAVRVILLTSDQEGGGRASFSPTCPTAMALDLYAKGT